MADVKKHFLDFNKKSGFYFSRVLNRPFVPPELLQISITHRCPLRCKMCSVVKVQSKLKEEMTTEEMKSVIDQACDMGIREFYLTGGEPFIRKDFFEIINYAGQRGMNTFVNTSGLLIDQKTAEKIVDSSLFDLTFSIDGLEKTHDFLRGPGVFSKAITAIKEINRLKSEKGKTSPRINILTIIMNQNLADIIPLVRFAEDLGISGVHFQPLLVDNSKMFVRDQKNVFWIPPDKLGQLELLIRQLNEYKKYSKVDLIFDAKLLMDYFSRKLKHHNKCFVGYNRLFIGLWGNVGLVCPVDSRNFAFLESFRKKTLSEIWNSEKAKEARYAVKSCKKECVQGCALMPEAEDLKKIYRTALKSFLMEAPHNHETIDFLNFINENLSYYESMLSAHKESESLRKENKTDLKEIENTLKIVSWITNDIKKRIMRFSEAVPQLKQQNSTNL